MLKAIRAFFHYIQSFYSQLSVTTITSKVWETDPIPFRCGVFQGDTLSPIMFLLVLKLAESLNQSCGYRLQVSIACRGTDMLPPVETTV